MNRPKSSVIKTVAKTCLIILAAIVLMILIAFISYYTRIRRSVSETSPAVTGQTTEADADVSESAADTSGYDDIKGHYQTQASSGISATGIVYDQASFESFNTYIDNRETEYPCTEMITSGEADSYFAENDFSKNITHSRSGIIKNGVIDEAALLESVKVNSPAFKKAGNHYLYTDITSDEEYAAIIKLIAEAINPDLPGKTPEELAELDCTLADLKIYYGVGTEFAKVTTERAMLINSAMIEAGRITTGKDTTYRDTIYHESKHLEQVDCPDRADAGHVQMGISRVNYDLTIDPYKWMWTVEGGAELAAMNVTGAAPTTYNFLVGYVETLDLISLPNELNVNGQAVEETTTDRDISSFYRLMGIGNGLTEAEVVKMMYSMEIVQSRVEDYQSVYADIYGCELSDSEYVTIRETYRASFLTEASRIFYNNLAEALVGQTDVTLEDIFALITVYEGDLDFHLKYHLAENLAKDYDREFLQNYNDMQTAFFESLALANSMQLSDIYDQFNDYLLFADEDHTTLNCTLEWMNAQKMVWLTRKADSSRISYTRPVNLIVTDLGENR